MPLDSLGGSSGDGAAIRPSVEKFAWALVFLGFAAQSRADDVEMRADTALRIYEVRSPITPVVWSRRRLVQSLSLSWVRPLAVREAPGARLVTHLSLRLDQDFGDTCFVNARGCMRPSRVGDEGDFQPLAREGFVDAQAAWIETRGLPLSTRIRAGRQTRVDVAGFSRIDGIVTRVEPLAHAAVEVYGGTMVRRTSPAGTDAFAPEGSLRLHLPGDLDPGRAPYVAPPSTTWIFGGQLTVGAPRIVRARLGYRHVFDGAGWVSRRVGVGAASRPVPRLRLDASGVWDVEGVLTDATVGARMRLAAVTLEGRLSRHVPRFDYGTIWAYFDVVPVRRARVSATFRRGRFLSVTAHLLGRRTDLGEQGTEVDGGGGVRLRWDRGGATLHAAARAEGGDLGPVLAMELGLRRVLRTWVSLFGRASLFRFDDPLRPTMHGVSVTETLGATLRVTENTGIDFDLEHVYSRVTGHRLRGLAILGVQAWR